MDVKDNSDLRNYVNCDFITLDEGFATYTSFKKMFRLAGIEPKAITTVSDIFSILNLVQAGIYISLIPSRVKSFYEKTFSLSNWQNHIRQSNLFRLSIYISASMIRIC